MIETVVTALALIVPLVLAIVCHEVAHGWVALLLGDRTAFDSGRLTLNPIRHVHPVGTVLMPGALALMGLPIFGFAKPVPVNARRLRNPRRAMMVVAAAGPLTNLLLAALGAALVGMIAAPSLGAGPVWQFFKMMLDYFVVINVFLALFNLLPIPPFDGSHIVEGLLPLPLARAYSKLRPYSLAAVIALIVVVPYIWPGLGIVENIVLPPVYWALERYDAIAGAVARLWW